MNGSAGPERQRSGVIHWGLGLRLWHDPDGPVVVLFNVIDQTDGADNVIAWSIEDL